MEKFTFKPNPQFDPPDMETGVLTAMAGEIWIDPVQERVVRLAGSLQQDKNIALGIVELDKGGWVEIEQADVGDGTWDTTRMRLGFTGTILLVKSLNISSDETLSDFRRIPADTTFAKGVEMLKAEQARLAANRALGAATTGPKSQ